MHSVWLAKGGRRRLKTMRLQLITYLTMHGTNLTSIALGSVSIFQLAGYAKPQKKKGAIFELRKKTELYGMYKNIYHYVFSFTKTNKQLHKRNKQQATKQTKWA